VSAASTLLVCMQFLHQRSLQSRLHSGSGWRLSTQPLPVPGLACRLTLRTLVLSGNPFGDQGIAMLAGPLTGLQHLTSLSLRQCGITDWSAPQVGPGVRGWIVCGAEAIELLPCYHADSLATLQPWCWPL
jgi:hypothetical protein